MKTRALGGGHGERSKSLTQSLFFLPGPQRAGRGSLQRARVTGLEPPGRGPGESGKSSRYTSCRCGENQPTRRVKDCVVVFLEFLDSLCA